MACQIKEIRIEHILHPNRERIERELAKRERTLFNLDDTFCLYDLTSTYFEGQAQANLQAKPGYSRDQRPDRKQVLVGLASDRNGFPKAREVFDGNRQDRAKVKEMLDTLERRAGEESRIDCNRRPCYCLWNLEGYCGSVRVQLAKLPID